ncbi:MAG: PAS domain S-box protein [Deltaproteobacteria bacterium]|nr:PAS domain S-box protein [Deltaproteobacteria bacterium]
MKKNPPSKISNQQSLRTLMIDDSEDDVLLIIRELKKGGYNPLYERLETAAAMEKALKDKTWDIILCDYKMPKFNAPSAIALLKETNINIPLIVVSGTIGEETAIECMRLGAQDYIMKSNLFRLCPAIARELEEATARDKQKQAESQREAALEALRQSEEKYRAILENMQEGYFEVDLAGNFTFFNDTVCRDLGYPKEELMGMNNRQYTEKEELKKVFQAYHKVYTTGEPIKEFGWEITRKDGAKRYIAGSMSLKKDSSGNPTGFRGIARDITERKQMEEKLLNEEQRFRALAEQSSDIIVLVNREGIITYENPAVDILGIKPEERIDASAFEHVHPDDLTLITDSFNILFSDTNAPVQKAEIRLRRADGGWCTFEAVASNLVRDNVVEAAMVNLRDITERKRAENALRKSEKYFKEITENSSDIIVITDENGNIKYCSTSIERFTGYKPEEVIGKSGFMFIHPDEIKRASDEFGEAILTNNSPIAPNAFRIVHKDGSERYFDGTGKNLLHNPDVAGIVMNIRDITERKQAEEALKKSEAKYRNIFENAMEGIYQSTTDGRFITVNVAFARMAGYNSPEELIETIKDIGTQLYVHPEDRDRFLEIRAKKGSVEGFETEFYKKNGSTFWVVINARAVKDEQGKILYTEGLIEDITLRKHAEKKLHQSLDSLKKAVNTTIQVLVSALEVRDPYTAGHQSRSANLAFAIAREMGLDKEKMDGIRMAGIIHDIGKLSIPVEILSKPTKLTNIEFSLIKEHSKIGYEMLKDVESPWPLAQIVYQHHDRMDGSGYPRNLKGDEILMESRIMAVADVVEAMASHRPYRPTLGIEAALEEITKNRGILYDNAVADTCLRLFREKGYQFT